MATLEHKQNNIYLEAEKTWISLTTESEKPWIYFTNESKKKSISWKYLLWCKKQRDRFDDSTSEDIFVCDDTLLDQYENKWAARVTIWRQRFNILNHNLNISSNKK